LAENHRENRMTPSPPAVSTAHRRIALWLLVVCRLVFTMVVLGGVPRLTHSGLSIVEWQPLVGAIPPLSHQDWLELFEKYKLTPEYRHVNADMDLAGFQGIFWLEYFHRLLGRSIGLVFLVPFLYFLVRKQIDRPLAPKLVTMFVLGGLQGLMGWLMVASGLVDMPRVSAYRLTAHLGLALLIYGYILWVALGLLWPRSPVEEASARRLRGHGKGVTTLIVITLLAGGFVAGTRAGFAFNDWPFMHGKLIPDGLYAMHPLWEDWFENIATVQFHHRMLAYLLVLMIPAWWWMARRQSLDGTTRLLFHLLLAMLVVQVLLGITTLLYVVPIPLAAAHQAGAMALFTIALFLNHRLRRAD